MKITHNLSHSTRHDFNHVFPFLAGFSSPDESTGRATALPPASAFALVSASALTKMFKFYVKVFKILYFLNLHRDLVYV